MVIDQAPYAHMPTQQKPNKGSTLSIALESITAFENIFTKPTLQMEMLRPSR